MSKDGGTHKKPTIPFQNKPFYLHGQYISFECHHGNLHYTPKKRSAKDVKKRSTIYMSKKVGCLAKVVVKEATFFHGLKCLRKGSKREKLNILSHIKQLLAQPNSNVVTEKRFYMRIDSNHTLHPSHCFSGISNPIHKEVCKEIQALAEMGVRSAGVASICLDVLRKVKNQDFLSQGSQEVSSEIPDAKTIQNHLQIGLNRQKSCKDDQMNLMCLVSNSSLIFCIFTSRSVNDKYNDINFKGFEMDKAESTRPVHLETKYLCSRRNPCSDRKR
jgi:hypothetical protein